MNPPWQSLTLGPQEYNGTTPIRKLRDGKEIKFAEDIRSVTFGSAAHGVETRSVLLLGETGAGKTTFINAFAGYIYGVTLDDGFRLQVEDYGAEGKKPTESQTSGITIFNFMYKEGMKYHTNFQLIDTPGFNDTTDNSKPSRLLKNLLNKDVGITSINYIGLVIKSTENRNTKHFSEAIKEIESNLTTRIKNIVALETHCDLLNENINENCLLRDTNFTISRCYKLNNTFFKSKNEAIMNVIEKSMLDSYDSFTTDLQKSSSTSLVCIEELHRIKNVLDSKKSEYEKLQKKEKKCYDVLQKNNESLHKLERKDKLVNSELVELKFVKPNAIPEGKHAHFCSVCLTLCEDSCEAGFWDYILRNPAETGAAAGAGAAAAGAGAAAAAAAAAGAAGAGAAGAGAGAAGAGAAAAAAAAGAGGAGAGAAGAGAGAAGAGAGAAVAAAAAAEASIAFATLGRGLNRLTVAVPIVAGVTALAGVAGTAMVMHKRFTALTEEERARICSFMQKGCKQCQGCTADMHWVFCTDLPIQEDFQRKKILVEELKHLIKEKTDVNKTISEHKEMLKKITNVKQLMEDDIQGHIRRMNNLSFKKLSLNYFIKSINQSQ